MLTTSKRIPKRCARSRASETLPSDEYGPGIPMPVTFSFPIASTAIAATSAESIPPLNPICTLRSGAEDIFAQFSFSNVPRRSVDRHNQIGTLPDQFLYRITAITSPLPVLLVIPSVFADCERDSFALNGANALFVGR